MLSGLPADTLRAWEKRYRAVEPQRVNRRRLYSQADVNRLKLLKWAVDHGHRIGHVANKSADQLLELQGSLPHTQGLGSRTPDHVHRIIEKIKEYSLEADIELSKLATMMAPRPFVFEVVVPMMQEIGRLWEKKELSIAHEHLTTAAVRNILAVLLRAYGLNNQGPAIIFCTPPGEEHELGILIAAMIASIHGFKVLYFGVNLPLEDVAQTAKATQALAVVVAMNHKIPDDELKEQVRHLRALLPYHTHLVIGGSQSSLIQVTSTPAISVAPSFEVFDGLMHAFKRNLGVFPSM